ncbi:hypothetical protein [Gracilibacillus xinjiangensis]|uniref:Uncharacterized protein n=1 Tax=Gracilibacillus xinjiangensis TaxID=1193282 RepID=A0ABV8WRQ7_9BACI
MFLGNGTSGEVNVQGELYYRNQPLDNRFVRNMGSGAISLQVSSAGNIAVYVNNTYQDHIPIQ